MPRPVNEAENASRRDLLGEFRGFRQNRELFLNFPATIAWSRQTLTRRDLEKIQYVNTSYWNELSAGTRLPSVAVRMIQTGELAYGQSNQLFWDLAHALRQGHRLPEMILVGMKSESRLVVLEGHARLTAYFLAHDILPETLTAIVGLSDELSSWMALGDDGVTD